MAENKPDAKLVRTPVDGMCGSPSNRNPSGSTTQEVYGLKGPDGLSANGGVEFNLVMTDINPSTGSDKPSDSGTFKGSI